MSRPGKAKPKRAAGGGSWSGALLVPALVVLLLLGCLVALALLMTSAPATAAPASAAFSRSAPAAAEGKCEDQHEMCAAWHKGGACKRSRSGAPAPAEMRSTCPRTCGLCPGFSGRVPPVPAVARCRRDNHSASVPKGQLTPLFERVLRDFPQFSPVALSTDPYVVQLHDFISPAEAAAFQRVCAQHFERSLAGDQLNPVRTSFQCWCNFPGCFMDEDIQRVTRRIHHLTGTHFDNGEDIQVVRYEPGQFYRVHHDQNTAVWAPQGPRVLTFFMYLNTPEGGGETWFPQVNDVNGSRGIMVQPRAGSAILWPSTLDAEPMHADHRTNHAAQPVTQGIKFAANMWIHQFDFKTPSERGCPLTYVNTVGHVPREPEHIQLTKGYVPDYETEGEPGLHAA